MTGRRTAAMRLVEVEGQFYAHTEDVTAMLRALAEGVAGNEAYREVAGEFAATLRLQADEFEFGALTAGLTP